MDQRREPRFVVNQVVTATVLGPKPRAHTVTVQNASGRGLALVLPEPVEIGEALKIEFGDAMALGEAVHCQSLAQGFLVGIALDQALYGLSELGKKLLEFGLDVPTVPTAAL
jgi:hypothetical protein